MKTPPTRLPLTIALDIPANWTPEQALAVFELLDDLRERIWEHYRLPLTNLIREQRGPTSNGNMCSLRDTEF